jgi:nitrogen fixation/metabolism regulation signal transduction histidine kinase
MNQFERKPFKHFFIKKALQIRMIIHIVTAVLVTTILSVGTMTLVYFLKYNTVIMYQLDQETQNLTHQSIVSLLLPSLLFSAVVNILVAAGIGFYASRKYAIPVYKLEQWSSLLLQGKMTAVLQFREKEELKGLSDKCNEVTTILRNRLQTIKQQVGELKKAHQDSPAIQQIEKSLDGLDLSTGTIEVNHSYASAALDKEHGKKS